MRVFAMVVGLIAFAAAGCVGNGQSGRELSGRLVPTTFFDLRLPGGYGATLDDGKNNDLELSGFERDKERLKIDKLVIKNNASEVVTADAQVVGIVERMQYEQMRRLEHRDTMEAVKFQSAMQAVSNLATSLAPALIRAQPSTSLSLPTPYGPISASREAPALPVGQLVPIQWQPIPVLGASSAGGPSDAGGLPPPPRGGGSGAPGVQSGTLEPSGATESLAPTLEPSAEAVVAPGVSVGGSDTVQFEVLAETQPVGGGEQRIRPDTRPRPSRAIRKAGER